MVQKYDITLSGGIHGAAPKKERRRKQTDTWLYLGVVGQIGYTVAIPLVAGVLAGVFIDRTAGTKPVATLIGLGLGAVISVIGFVRTLQEVLKNKI